MDFWDKHALSFQFKNRVIWFEPEAEIILKQCKLHAVLVTSNWNYLTFRRFLMARKLKSRTLKTTLLFSRHLGLKFVEDSRERFANLLGNRNGRVPATAPVHETTVWTTATGGSLPPILSKHGEATTVASSSAAWWLLQSIPLSIATTALGTTTTSSWLSSLPDSLSPAAV